MMVNYQELSWILTCVFAVTVTLATIRKTYFDRKEHEELIKKFKAETDYYRDKLLILKVEDKEKGSECK